MKNILRSLLSGICAAAFVVVAHAANLAPGAFSAGTVKGDVTYRLAGSSQFMALTAGTALPQGAVIRTGADSLAAIVFSNGATATIAPSSEVEITKFEQEVFSGPLPTGSEPSVSNTSISIIDGSVVSQVSKLKSGSSYVVNTPVGAAGVRGTVYRVTYNRATGAFNVATLSGDVVFQHVGSDNRVVPVSENQEYSGGNVISLSPEQIAFIQNLINNTVPTTGTGTSGTGASPTTSGPTLNSIDTSIPVSPGGS